MTRARWLTTKRGWPQLVSLWSFFWSLVIGHWSFDAGAAAAPTLDHLFPAALQVGTTNTVTAIGKFEPWPPKAWVDASGIVFKPDTNSGKFSVEIANDAPIGPHLVRFFNEQGSSGPRFLIVTRDFQVAEAEPNDDFRKPQVFESLPAHINGRLERSGDVDSFAVQLEAGQTLVASVEAFTLASPVDAVLRVVDARGVQRAFDHDGATLDPILAWTPKVAGSYVVQIFGFAYPAESDVKFTGNNKCVYRLHLSRGAYVRHTLPLGVQRGVSTSLRMVGWNLRHDEQLQFDGVDLPAGTERTTLHLPGCDQDLSLPVGDGPEIMEQQWSTLVFGTNDAPFAITGCIEKPGVEDRFSFTARKDQKFLIEVQSASLGFPLDAWLKVENSKGKEVGKNDDSGGVDPRLEWTAGGDGTFAAVVGNVLQRGGPEYLYRLSVREATPSVKLSVSETAFAIPPGKTNDLKVTVKRLHGFKAKLSLSAKDLPDGLVLEQAEVPEKSNDVTLKLIAASDAKPFSGPIRILATESDSEKEHRVLANLTSSTENNGVPGGFTRLAIESTDRLWLTVLPASEQKAEKPK